MDESKLWAGLDILLALFLLYMAYTELTGNYPFKRAEPAIEAQHVPIEQPDEAEKEEEKQDG